MFFLAKYFLVKPDSSQKSQITNNEATLKALEKKLSGTGIELTHPLEHPGVVPTTPLHYHATLLNNCPHIDDT